MDISRPSTIGKHLGTSLCGASKAFQAVDFQCDSQRIDPVPCVHSIRHIVRRLNLSSTFAAVCALVDAYPSNPTYFHRFAAITCSFTFVLRQRTPSLIKCTRLVDHDDGADQGLHHKIDRKEKQSVDRFWPCSASYPF